MSEIDEAMEQADCLFSANEVDAAIAEMAQKISTVIRDKNPVVLTIMNGGLFTTAMLLRYFDFPMQQDYMHLSRYRGDTVGGDIHWLKKPEIDLENRTVLLVDDLLDHGITLHAAVAHCNDEAAAEVLTAVLVVKDIKDRHGLARVDFHGLATPDRYLFGSGMDYKSYWRNAHGIFAV